MANTNWITAKITEHQQQLKAKSIQDELALQNEKRFKSLLTRWLDETFELELRESLNAFNNQSGKMHGPQLNRTPQGFQLMAQGLPDYEIIVDGDGHVITHGFARQSTNSINLIAGHDKILPSDGLPIAMQVLEPYFDVALERMT